MTVIRDTSNRNITALLPKTSSKSIGLHDKQGQMKI